METEPLPRIFVVEVLKSARVVMETRLTRKLRNMGLN
ncbi:hypothetical protein Metvu_0774 [Methanocaldococcus vulcanius M7]|uniref:Uncharacterized protein n=1 Tax=Methanocaldococcus vulcanius (strain ATCC 700851 / DSM 12094 / M7) TaxID=579137 RepID=C9RGD0_METVM|nr:hypothetical protein Metvu_0774 [Methanocaldococcus vulcanius M7]